LGEYVALEPDPLLLNCASVTVIVAVPVPDTDVPFTGPVPPELLYVKSAAVAGRAFTTSL
jgi:hypothetical protein